MQGQDHGTITLATLCPGRPKPLTSHPVKVAPGFISRQLSSKIPVISAFPAHPPPLHHFLHCQVVHLLFFCSCWRSRLLCNCNSTCEELESAVTVCYCHQVVLWLVCTQLDQHPCTRANPQQCNVLMRGRAGTYRNIDADYSKHRRQIPNTNLRDQIATFLRVISMTIKSRVLLVRRMNAGSTGLRAKVRASAVTKIFQQPRCPDPPPSKEQNPLKCRLFFKTM